MFSLIILKQILIFSSFKNICGHFFCKNVSFCPKKTSISLKKRKIAKHLVFLSYIAKYVKIVKSPQIDTEKKSGLANWRISCQLTNQLIH